MIKYIYISWWFCASEFQPKDGERIEHLFLIIVNGLHQLKDD